MEDDALWPDALDRDEREALRTVAKYLFDAEGFGLTYKEVAEPISKQDGSVNVTDHNLRNFAQGMVDVPNQRAFLRPLLKYIVEKFREPETCPEDVKTAYQNLLKLRKFPYSIAMRVLLGKRDHIDYPQPLKKKYLGNYFAYRWTRSIANESRAVSKSLIKIIGFDDVLKLDTYIAVYKDRRSEMRRNAGYIITISDKIYLIGHELEDLGIDATVLSEVRGSSDEGFVSSLDGLMLSTSSAGDPIAARVHLVRISEDQLLPEDQIGIFPLDTVREEIRDFEIRIDNGDLSDGGVLDTYLA